ncbi:MAG: CBS domain-containing protein [Desulfobacterales bacterium]
MEKLKVKDLMVPVDKFTRISSEATIYEGLAALEKAQEKYMSGESEQRILLVEEKNGDILGKMSPIDLLSGLESKYKKVDYEDTLKHLGLRYIWTSMQKEYNLWGDPFTNLCRKASDVKIKDFIKSPSEGQKVNSDDSIGKCLHLFIMTRHDSLFVYEAHNIIGLLRFSDVYRKASQAMKECGF